MSKNVKYWLWLQKALGVGVFNTSIIDEFKSIENLYNANILELKMSSSLTQKQIAKLEQTDKDCVDEVIYTCVQNNWQIIDYDDEKYPKRLKQIFNPPAVLFVDGLLPDIDNNVTIGIVGTRKASDYSITVTDIMSRGITEAGAIVVSGGALGVDSAAHRGALIAGGKTIAVLGCGLGSDYLKQNEELRSMIRNNGALVTEYFPFAGATRYTFPQRNRIISGLSLGVLVTEAGVKSGSLITARYANEQNRDLFAIPSSVLSAKYSGTNKLIEDGAIVAVSPKQIISMYKQKYKSVDINKVRTVEEIRLDDVDLSANVKHEERDTFATVDEDRIARAEKQDKAFNLKDNEKIVYDCLDNKFKNANSIAQETDLHIKDVLSALTILEIKGLAVSASGKRYKLS